MRASMLLLGASLLALLLVPGVVRGENIDLGSDYNVSVYMGMHTINFTQILSQGFQGLSRGAGSYGINATRVLEAIRNITMGCDTLSCLAGNRSARSSVEQGVRELERSGYLDPALADEILSSIDQAYLSDEALKRLLSNPELAGLLSNISSQGSSANVLGILDSLFRGGRISLPEYIAALELLKRFSQRQGLESEVLAIDRMQIEIIRQLVLSGTAEGFVRSLTNMLLSSNNQGQALQQQDVRENSRSIPLAIPGYHGYVPGIYAGIEAFSILAALLVSSAIVALAIAGPLRRFLRLPGSRVYRRSSGLGGGEKMGGVIAIYWAAVNIISKRSPRRGSETHREYLERVRGILENPGAFEDLTYIYEKVRFAHEPEDRYYDRAVRDYRELRGS